ncbi:hypothetical protein HID58_075152 [Brassica napus]|uniref:Uncharacterized protein n=1 Tax=Brassica napus TaxID=3708 RepID=A0ABQ7YIT1_BRANA|nr:hypothetical protein HID58_075152 [Brassica napus]
MVVKPLGSKRFCLHIVDTINAKCHVQFAGRDLQAPGTISALFYNSQTQFMPRPAVVDKLVKLVTVTLGSSYHYPLKSGFRNSKSDLGTRISFKYSISRGVSSTPTVYVNGFELLDAGSPIDFEGWKTPLILWLTHEKRTVRTLFQARIGSITFGAVCFGRQGQRGLCYKPISPSTVFSPCKFS